jgi:hypothetical protein
LVLLRQDGSDCHVISGCVRLCQVMSFYFRFCLVGFGRSGCARLGWLYQASTCYVMLGQVITCWARLGQFRTGYARLLQHRSGYYRLGQDSSG